MTKRFLSSQCPNSTLLKSRFNLTKVVSNQSNVVSEYGILGMVFGKLWNKTPPASKTVNYADSSNFPSLISCLFYFFETVAPLVITMKIIFQNLWKQGVSWDDSLPINNHHILN